MRSSNELYQLVGRNLASLRKEIGITQEKLVEDTGLSLSFISQIESPNVDKGVSLDTLWLISQTYKKDIKFFFRGSEHLIDNCSEKEH